MIPREAQSKYVSDVIKIHLFLQDILTLLAKNTRKYKIFEIERFSLTCTLIISNSRPVSVTSTAVATLVKESRVPHDPNCQSCNIKDLYLK